MPPGFYGIEWLLYGFQVSEQTQLIRSLGLDAAQIEGITSAVSRSMEKAREAVAEAIAGEGNPEERVFRVLQNIAAGEIPAKQAEMLCLKLAAAQPCPHPGRGCCMGCGYEIYTKSSFQLLMREYASLMQKRNLAEGMERTRYNRLMEQGILPAAAQILESIPALYPEADMEPMLEMLERGIAYAAACK